MCLRYQNSRQDSGLYFEKGTVYFNQAGQPGLTVYKADGTEIVPSASEYEGQTNTGINITNLGPYYTEIKYFLECLRDGKEITLAPLQEGSKIRRTGTGRVGSCKAVSS